MLTLGLDIGGANLKAANSDGIARSVAFALWKHPERLAEELARLCNTMPPYEQVAVTMTGELCDCFATRRAGVHAILQSVRDALGSASIRVWNLHRAFVSLEQADADPLSVAAANWLAQAQYVAQRYSAERVLLIDVGSTTTDLVYLDRGVPQPLGYTDRERLASGELVYTGLRRTPICAVLGAEVAAELFATMQDVYVFQRLIPEDANDCDTADGRPATREAAHARLARLYCADVETFTEQDAFQLAARAMQSQWHAIDRAILAVLKHRPPIERFVLSGSGEVVGRSVWARSVFGQVPATALTEELGADLSQTACAYAVALLAKRQPT